METKIIIIALSCFFIMNCGSPISVNDKKTQKMHSTEEYYYDFGMFTDFKKTVAYADTADTIYLNVETIKYISLSSNNPISDSRIKTFEMFELNDIVKGNCNDE